MHTREKGQKGEEIAGKFLESKGFTVVAKNYQKKWGEIDIIVTKNGVLHFVEVKSVNALFDSSSDSHRPEENVHPLKAKKIKRMISTYISEKGINVEAEFYFHVLCVFMNFTTHKARVKWIKNVIL